MYYKNVKGEFNPICIIQNKENYALQNILFLNISFQNAAYFNQINSLHLISERVVISLVI